MAGGAGAALVALAASGATGAALGLRVGMVYEGSIRIEGSVVSLLIGGEALTLKTAADLANGQRVQAQLVRTAEGLQVRLTVPGGNQAQPGEGAARAALTAGQQPQAANKPHPASTQQAAQPATRPPTVPPSTVSAASIASKPLPTALQPGGSAPSAATAGAQGAPTASETAQLARLAGEVARSFPPGVEAHRLAPLLPRQLPPSESLVRAAMQVLAAREAAGADLVTLGRAFALAAERGAVPASTAGFVLAFQVTDGAQSESWLGAIQRWVEAASKPLEARLAAALRGGAEPGKPLDLGQELRSVLLQARSDEGIARALQREGDVDGFRQAIDRAVERLTGSQAHNLRSFDGPYLFAELPGHERFHRAQLHLFGDGNPEGQTGGQRQVVLDLSLQRLGDLWLALSVFGQRCQCTVRVADPAILPEVAAAAGELEAALADAGFPAAEVRVLAWDGDRVGALADVLATRDRLDLEA